MNSFAVLFLCIQGFLAQNVFSQCTSRATIEAPGFAAPYGFAASPLAAPFAPAAASLATTTPYGYRAGYPDIAYSAAGFPPYGGAGEGNVAVAGELPVAGSTAITGQVPIMGAVNFGGVIPAAGAVTITGQCACGCGVPYGY